jgi:two-component system NtrC family sensor kinase
MNSKLPLLMPWNAKNDELVRINNDLERLISGTELKINLQNEMPARMQIVNNAIPVAVIGVDLNGYIVQCNKEAMDLCNNLQGDTLGNRFQDKLPKEICEFIEKIPGKQSMSASFVIHGEEIKVTVGFIDNSDQGGMLLIFANEGRYV